MQITHRDAPNDGGIGAKIKFGISLLTWPKAAIQDLLGSPRTGAGKRRIRESRLRHRREGRVARQHLGQEREAVIHRN